jgi:hypothetical protein
VNPKKMKMLVLATATAVSAGLGGQALASANDSSPPEANASATPLKGATFKGKTSQKRTVTFRVAKNGRSARISRLGYRAKCAKGGTVTQTVRRSPKIRIRGGVLRLRSTLITFTGKFTSRRRAKGTFRISTANLAGRRCKTGTLRWSARAR